MVMGLGAGGFLTVSVRRKASIEDVMTLGIQEKIMRKLEIS